MICSTAPLARPSLQAILFFLISFLAGSQSWTMRASCAEIFVIPPKEPIAVFGNASQLFISGEIEPGTAEQLEAVITKHDVAERSVIYLNSPGGSLFGGIALGRTIRKHGFITYVAAVGESDKQGADASGVCFSACALAYLGGEFRYEIRGSRYGVHRFYFSQSSGEDVDTAQVVSAAIVNYLREMDIDIGLFDASTRAGKDEVYEPSAEELRRLNVVNDGFTQTKWSIESNEDVIYLKGERDTIHGINKFMVMCSNSKLSLYVIFDPQGREEDVASFSAYSVVIDGNRTPVKPADVSFHNGWFNGFFQLDQSVWKKLSTAESVGLMVQFDYDAPVFWGFNSMPFSEGKKLLSGVLGTCR